MTATPQKKDLDDTHKTNSYLTYECNEDNILVFTMDNPASRYNMVSQFLLNAIKDILHKGIHWDSISGVVITSAKKDNFVVGADIHEFIRIRTREQGLQYIRNAQEILEMIADLPVPVVSAVRGRCLGGGFELALASDYIIAADSPDTVFGLPEVQLGVIPAGGGTQRLPRIIGLRKSLPYLMTGKNIRAPKALELGIIDEIVKTPGLKQHAIRRAVELSQKADPAEKRKLSLPDRIIEATPAGRELAFRKAVRMVDAGTSGHYPAPYAIIESVKFGLSHGLKKGLANDAELIADLITSPVTKNLTKIFMDMTELKKNPLKEMAPAVEKISIIGTGYMGTGIASVSLGNWMTVALKDINMDITGKAMGKIWRGLEKRVSSGSLNADDARAMFNRIVPGDEYDIIMGSDMVIEAVHEDAELKRQILHKVQEVTDERTIFATGSPAIPVSHIAKGAVFPENVIGMHYFSPVRKIPLIEIVKTEKTSDRAVATAIELAIKQGKPSIVVKDGPGFYTTRILGPMLNEAVLLVEEGNDIREIDHAMQQFGFPVGPISLIDDIGIDIGAHVSDFLGRAFIDTGIRPAGSLFRLYRAGLFGKKNRRGFYRYEIKKNKIVREKNLELEKFLDIRHIQKSSREELQTRISMLMINEAVKCLEESVISSPKDGDAGAVLGLGFPPFLGGPFRYIDSTGAGRISDEMKELCDRFGVRFSPSPLLDEMACLNRTFY